MAGAHDPATSPFGEMVKLDYLHASRALVSVGRPKLIFRTLPVLARATDRRVGKQAAGEGRAVDEVDRMLVVVVAHNKRGRSRILSSRAEESC